MFFFMDNLIMLFVMENYNGKCYMVIYDIIGKKINDIDCYVNLK